MRVDAEQHEAPTTSGASARPSIQVRSRRSGRSATFGPFMIAWKSRSMYAAASTIGISAISAGHTEAGCVDAGEDQQLAGEPGQSRQPERRERRTAAARRASRGFAARQAAEARERTRLLALFDVTRARGRCPRVNSPCATM